jgi:hypothetical protein
LSAVPSGVTGDHFADPEGACSNCQKVFISLESCPRGSTTHEPAEVAVPLGRGGCGTGGSVALGTSVSRTAITISPTRRVAAAPTRSVRRYAALGAELMK